uniref:Histidine decarboxylase n=1 Tax=Pseudonaja textilis TaxID=8673 RepID=A0A670YH20_PSETE
MVFVSSPCYRFLGKEMVDYICQYLTNIRERRVYPDVQPGYMRDQLPDGAPLEPESWDSIFRDIENIIMPGASSPACTELEMNVMDWLAQMMGLPETFLHYHPGSKGGGILQVCATLGTTGVCAFDCLSELGPILWFPLQHWQIPLSRRFRSLKLWFVIRSFGVKKLQDHVRHVSEIVSAQNWKSEEIPTDENVIRKILECAETNRLTLAIKEREQTDYYMVWDLFYQWLNNKGGS